jgi:histidinol phosphatase-like PHP family hydrolase
MTMSRRKFLAGAAAAAGALAVSGKALPAADGPAPGSDGDLPRVDFHVHLDDLGIEKAVEFSKERGVKFGIVEHAGTKENKYPVVLSSDEDLKRYIAMLDGKPVYKGVQAEFTDWMTCFSKPAIAQLDYVLTDALTFPEKDGRRIELWKKEKVKIADPQDFMDRYVEHHLKIITTEPIDILANGTYLPEVLQRDFDALWTEARMQKIIDACVKCHVAIEISSGFKLPKLVFLRMAKAAGARFSFGSNGRGQNVGRIEHSVEMARKLGLKREDLFSPAPPGKKPVEVRKL